MTIEEFAQIRGVSPRTIYRNQKLREEYELLWGRKFRPSMPAITEQEAWRMAERQIKQALNEAAR
jgi:hypothetical protein